MWHKKHIIRKVIVPFTVLTALLGGGAAPALAEAGAAGTPPGPGGTGPTGPTRATVSSGGHTGTPGPGPGILGGDPRDQGARVFTGEAFDTCLAPSSAAMRAWYGTSPFGAAGVYIGGRARACQDQANLDRDWVHAVHGMGWELLPIYVGSQSPCVISPRKRRYAMGESGTWHQGAQEGRAAVREAQALGMTAHSAIYLDMEAYNNKNADCAATTLRFIQGWNRAVQKQGYLPGFYSSADSGIEHMEGARKAGHKDLPQMLWFARWRVPASVQGEKALDELAWQPHRRIHQYDGDVKRSYGGYRMNIDRNMVDAPVAIVG